MAVEVRNNPDESRYEVYADGQRAGVATYRMRGDVVEMMHTETDEAFAGRGLGTTLARGALDEIRERGLRVRPFCPFIRTFIAGNRDYVDLVREEERERFDLSAA